MLLNSEFGNMNITKNSDGTYKGTILSDNSMIEYPRLNITWKNRTEYGEALDIKILSAKKANGCCTLSNPEKVFIDESVK